MENWLNSINIIVNGKKVGSQGDTFNSKVFSAKSETSRTPTIFGDQVVFKLNNNDLFKNKEASNLLAHYISGVDACVIRGTALEAAFVDTNADDFVKRGKVKCLGQKFENYVFDEKSDGDIKMPTLQEYNGQKFYVLDGKTFDKFGNAIDIKIEVE